MAVVETGGWSGVRRITEVVDDDDDDDDEDGRERFAPLAALMPSNKLGMNKYGRV